jgi:hypothetical protein
MAIMFIALLKINSSVLVLYQCRLALNSVIERNQQKSRELMRRVFWLMLGHAVIYFAIFVTELKAIGSLVGQFEDQQRDMPQGQYSLKHNGKHEQFTHKRGENGELSLEEQEGIMAIIMFGVSIYTLCMSVCCLLICCAPIFGCYYKHYDAIKKHDQLQMQLTGDMPNPSMQQNAVA